MPRPLRFFGSALAMAFGLALVAAPAPADAQDRPAGCILDHCQDKLGPTADPGAAPAAPTENARPQADDADAPSARADAPAPAPTPARVAPGAFDYYVLALSWSPGFCASRGGSRSGQCAPGAGLGFVVHGLWPQNERGYPADCDGLANPPRYALQAARGLYPDEGLARYEWRKHGTCTGLAPTAYFAEVRRARDLVTVPQTLAEAHEPQRTSPADIQRAFLAANPRLRPGMMSVGCAGGALQEVRICMTKDLRDFRACPEVARQTCRAGSISVPPPM